MGCCAMLINHRSLVRLNDIFGLVSSIEMCNPVFVGIYIFGELKPVPHDRHRRQVTRRPSCDQRTQGRCRRPAGRSWGTGSP